MYFVFIFNSGCPHIGHLREASGLACVPYPKVTYKLKMDKRYYEPGGSAKYQLSGPQVEAVVLACQSHTKFFHGTEVLPDPDKKIPLVDEDHDDEDEHSLSDRETEEAEDELEDTEEESFEEVDGAGGDDDEVCQNSQHRDAIDDAAILALGPATEHEKVYRRGFFLGDGTGEVKTCHEEAIIFFC